MSWTTPRTWVTGELVTASLLNQHLRDNLLDLRRAADSADVATTQTTTSTSYTDLTTPGPAVTLTTGTKAWVTWSAYMFNSGAFQTSMSFAVSGATTRAAGTEILSNSGTNGQGASLTKLITGLTAGSNVFTTKYLVAGGTGSFTLRNISVLDGGS